MRKLVFVFVSFALIAFTAGCQSADNSTNENQMAGMENMMELIVESGANWQSSMKILFFTKKNNPQMAAWIEDENGNYVTTISVTEKAARKNWAAAPKEGRPEALPVWNNRLPSSVSDDSIDALSSATKNEPLSTGVDESTLIAGNTYHVYLEINSSFDYNDAYTEDNSGVNGQPSMIYHAEFSAEQSRRITLLPIGHGSVDGSDGTIDDNLQSLTTALSIIKNAWIDVK